MLKKNDTESEPTKKGVFKWIVGILLLGGVVAGCFLIYRWWIQPSPQQLQQNREHKEILNKQIKEIEKAINNNRVRLEKLKRDEECPPSLEKIDEFVKSPNFDSSDQELVALENKKQNLLEEAKKTGEEWNKLIDKIKKHAANIWKRQKDGQWKMLTDKIAKSPEIKARFDKFIRTFYQRFGEKKGIKIYRPQIKFYGFGHFYINEEEPDSSTTEMGHTSCPKDDNIETLPSGEIDHFPMEINLNRIYLLNHGTIGMDDFYQADPETSGKFSIDFDHLIETIAHEIAHAVQNVINVDNYKKSVRAANDIICSQCASSGERDHNDKLLHPGWAAEHAKLTTEIQQMIESSPEYKEFKKWWQSSK